MRINYPKPSYDGLNHKTYFIMTSIINKINEITNELFNKYNTSFSISFNGSEFELLPEDHKRLAYNLELEEDSDLFWNALEEIRNDINSRLTDES